MKLLYEKVDIMRNYKLVGELWPILFFISNICYQCRSD